jgi:molybdenum cofactor cytidylyltransferase
MGSAKTLLTAPDGRPFLLRIVDTLREGGVSRLVVVTGTHHDAVVGLLAQLPPEFRPAVARNPAPERGQLTSLWVGMDRIVDPQARGVLVTLVDVPMVAASTVSAVVEAWRQSDAPIVRPAIGPRHGHPVIFGRRLFADLRRAPVEAGAKSVVRAHEGEIFNVPVDDEGCLRDIDTPDDYRRLGEDPSTRTR